MEATQKEKENGKRINSTPGLGLGKKLVPSSLLNFKGESNQNKYAELVNLEETQEETKEVQDEHEETVKSSPKQANFQVPCQGNSTPGKGNLSPSKIPKTIEDRHLEGSGENVETKIS
jgi:hypothetical protein